MKPDQARRDTQPMNVDEIRAALKAGGDDIVVVPSNPPPAPRRTQRKRSA